MERLTHQRNSGIKTGYWSPNKKEELIERLAAYENTGLTPEEIKDGQMLTGWISAEERLPEPFVPVIICRKGGKVEQGQLTVNGWWKVYGTNIKSVSAWIPLPKPYRPEEDWHEED